MTSTESLIDLFEQNPACLPRLNKNDSLPPDRVMVCIKPLHSMKPDDYLGFDVCSDEAWVDTFSFETGELNAAFFNRYFNYRDHLGDVTLTETLDTPQWKLKCMLEGQRGWGACRGDDMVGIVIAVRLTLEGGLPAMVKHKDIRFARTRIWTGDDVDLVRGVPYLGGASIHVATERSWNLASLKARSQISHELFECMCRLREHGILYPKVYGECDDFCMSPIFENVKLRDSFLNGQCHWWRPTDGESEFYMEPIVSFLHSCHYSKQIRFAFVRAKLWNGIGTSPAICRMGKSESSYIDAAWPSQSVRRYTERSLMSTPPYLQQHPGWRKIEVNPDYYPPDTVVLSDARFGLPDEHDPMFTIKWNGTYGRYLGYDALQRMENYFMGPRDAVHSQYLSLLENFMQPQLTPTWTKTDNWEKWGVHVASARARRTTINSLVQLMEALPPIARANFRDLYM